MIIPWETYHQWRRQRPGTVRAALAPSQAELRVLHVTDEEVDRNHAHLTTLPLVQLSVHHSKVMGVIYVERVCNYFARKKGCSFASIEFEFERLMTIFLQPQVLSFPQFENRGITSKQV